MARFYNIFLLTLFALCSTLFVLGAEECDAEAKVAEDPSCPSREHIIRCVRMSPRVVNYI